MCGQDVITKPVRLPGRIGVDAGDHRAGLQASWVPARRRIPDLAPAGPVGFVVPREHDRLMAREVFDEL